MLEDAQQVIPVQVALHPRRIVVDAERQVGGVGDVEEEALDVGLRRADIGGRRKDRAVGAVVLGEPDIGDGRLGVVAGAAEEDRHRGRSSSSRVSTMIFFFSSGESIEVSPVEPMIRIARVPWSCWNLSRRAKRREVDRAVLVERRDQGDERAGQLLARHLHVS